MRTSKNFAFISLLVMCALSACGDDEQEKVVNKEEEKVDSTEIVPQWPTAEEMASATYYPVGTKWEETWGAWRMKSASDGDSQTDANDSYWLKNHEQSYYEDHPYTLFTATYEVKEDVDADGKTYHYIEVSNDFVAPEEGKTSWPLLESMPKYMYIREDNGVIYRHTAHGLSRKVDTAYPVLAYNFVWTEGTLLQRVKLTTFGEDSSYEDAMETFGTVDSTSVENVKMADGSYCLYMAAAGLYRGIGTVEGGLFPDIDAIMPTTSYEIVREPICLKRFWRNDVLIYENEETAN